MRILAMEYGGFVFAMGVAVYWGDNLSERYGGNAFTWTLAIATVQLCMVLAFGDTRAS